MTLTFCLKAVTFGKGKLFIFDVNKNLEILTDLFYNIKSFHCFMSTVSDLLFGNLR